MKHHTHSHHSSDAQGDVDHSTAEMSPVDDELLTIAEVADIVRAPVATLRYWRHLGTGPRSFRVGRGVRYWRADVTTWLADQEQTDTARTHATSSSH